MAACLVSLGLATTTARARAGIDATAVVVEVLPDAARLVEPERTRRLMALELSDIEVPEPPDLAADTSTTLFFRVLRATPEALRVELWQLGTRYGSRSVSSIGAPQLITRRIALAAAELARQLRQSRRAAMHRAQQREPLEARKKGGAPGAPLRARLAFEAGTGFTAVGPGDFWIAGPALGGSLRFDTGLRLGLGLRWFAGGVPEMVPTGGLRWSELSLSPSYGMVVSEDVVFDVGATAAVAAVHVTRARGVDGSPSLDTWSARGTGHARFEIRLSRDLRLSLGPEVGVLLRRLLVEDASGTTHRLGGLHLGGAVGLVIDPAGG